MRGPVWNLLTECMSGQLLPFGRELCIEVEFVDSRLFVSRRAEAGVLKGTLLER